jgi:hypothetical protein
MPLARMVRASRVQKQKKSMDTHTRETPALAFTVQTEKGTINLSCRTDHLVIAGWVGRDKAALEAHIRELEAIGVPRPASTPVFYRVSAELITQSERVQVIGQEATGEAEVVLFRKNGDYWITIGSDLTDRKAETIGVTLSKQMCAKPVATVAWPLTEVRSHWDKLILRSWIEVNGKRILYQEGSVASMLPPWDLLSAYESGTGQSNDVMMFCGTLAVHGGIRWSDTFVIELDDPVQRRSMSFFYSMESLPVAG